MAGQCDSGSFESRGFTTGTLTGNNQSATVNMQFGSAVGLTVSDTNNEPVSGGQVTFTITPGTGGASATFGTAPTGCTNTSGTVSVCTLPMSGAITSPTFTANGTPGAFTILATANGVPTTTFNESNTGIAPTAVNDGPYTTPANTTLTVPAATGVLVNDMRGTPAATISANTQPAHGSVMLNTGDGSFAYTPAMGYIGADSFTYTLTNSVSMSTATVSVVVNGVAPTAVNDAANATTGLSVTIPVLANDTLGTPAATLTAVSTPMYGTATISGANIVYTSTTGYTGSDSFAYTISNGTGSSTGTVTVTVTAATVTSLSVTAPPANGGMMPTLRAGATVPLTTTATYSNGTTGAPTGVTYSGYDPKVIAVDTNGTVTGIAGGTTTITVSAPDGKGGTATTTITVTITGGTGGGLMNPNPQPMSHATCSRARG